MRTARLRLGIALAALLTAACLVPAAAVARGLGRCTVPVTHDPYDGFHIGVPNGWYLGRLNGMLVVTQNVGGTVEAVVEPVVLTRGLTTGHVFASVASSFEKEVQADGNSISFRVTSRRHGLVQAAVGGVASGSQLAGVAGVALLAHKTAHGSKLAVFYGYWAPRSQFRSERATLASIPACYGPQPGALLRIVRDQQFSYALPSGWTPSEQFNVLGVNDGNSAGAYYFLLEAATPSQGVTNAQTLLQYLFNSVGIKVTDTLYTVTAPSTTTVTGATAQAERTEFTGTLGSNPVHGMATVNSSTGGGVTSGVVRLAISTQSLWNSLSGVLLEIAGGIQHSFVQDLQQIAEVSQQWQAFGQQVSGFDDALNGVDIVTDPLTGEDYMANYDAYDQEGPNGPGYYLGDQKLNVITPS